MKVIGEVKTIGDSIMIHADNLLENLEDNDDVQNVYHNWENADE